MHDTPPATTPERSQQRQPSEDLNGHDDAMVQAGEQGVVTEMEAKRSPSLPGLPTPPNAEEESTAESAALVTTQEDFDKALLRSSLLVLRSQRDQRSILFTDTRTVAVADDHDDESILIPKSRWGKLVNSAVSATHCLVVNNSAVHFIHGPIVRRRSRTLGRLVDKAREGDDDDDRDIIHIKLPYPSQFSKCLSYLYAGRIQTFKKDLLHVLDNAVVLGAGKLVSACIEQISTQPGVWRRLNEVSSMDLELATQLLETVAEENREYFLKATMELSSLDVFQEEPRKSMFGGVVSRLVGPADEHLGGESVVGLARTTEGRRLLNILGVDMLAKLTSKLDADSAAKVLYHIALGAGEEDLEKAKKACKKRKVRLE
ncbi:hypothetical protein HK101_003885 [Irineochytrium annulatum]|nr:hypothetical protein HK101_003885 [Irineochytrium annulatum]